MATYEPEETLPGTEAASTLIVGFPACTTEKLISVVYKSALSVAV